VKLFFLLYVFLAVFADVTRASDQAIKEASGTAVTPETKNRLKTAVGLISTQEYKSAEEILRDIAESDLSQKNEAWFLLGRLYKEEGSFDKAEDFLKKAADASPLVRDYALKLLIDVYASSEKFENVILTAGQIKNSLLLKQAKEAEINALIALKRNKEAIDALSRYAEDYPSEWDRKFTHAILMKSSGMMEDAISLLKELYINASPPGRSAFKELQALKADSFTISEILRRADKLFEQNNFQKAETEYRNALKMPGGIEADKIRFSIGMCQFRSKQYTNAAQTFALVKNSEALYYRGWAFHRIDKRDEFEKVKKEFRELYPKDSRLASLLLMEADEFRRQKDFARAEKSFTEVITHFPGEAEDALWGLGWMHYSAESYADALKYFTQLTELSGSDNYYKYLYWKARSQEKADGEGKNDFYSGLPSDRSFYGYLIRMRSLTPAMPEKITITKPGRPEGELYERIDALIFLGMRDEAAGEIMDILKRVRNKDELFYLGYRAMELGEYRKVIASAGRDPDMEFLPFAFPFGFGDNIEEAAASHNVDQYLVAAVIREESRFDPSAVSWAGARGLMQLMPATAYRLKKEIGLPLKDRSEIHDVRKNVMLGTYYLSKLYKEFGEAPFVLAAYNAGENALKRWMGQYKMDDLIEFIENIPYKETRFYVKKVLRSYWQYRAINGLPLEGIQVASKGMP